MNLYLDTLKLLNKSDLSPEEVGKQSGLNSRWVRRLASGEMPNPGVNKTQELYNFLSKSKPKTKKVS